MPENESSPPQTLAVLLGASSFRRAPKLAQGRAFYNSAEDFHEYLMAAKGLGLPRENVYWLFDDSRSPSDQLQDIGDFLESRSTELKNCGTPPQDLILYYVGHGLFSELDQAFCLAIRALDEKSQGLTSIRGSDLASIIKTHARFLRKFLILDCCFSAAAYKEFQSGPLQAGRLKLLDEFPRKGTALLCAASAKNVAIAPEGLSRTMFSDSLLRALNQGHPSLGPRLSLNELGDLVKVSLREGYPDTWVRPEVQSPDQREGDVANQPLFPNVAYMAQKVEEVQQQAEAEKTREEVRQGTGMERAREEARQKVEAERVNPCVSPPKPAAVELRVLIPKRTILLGELQLCFVPGAVFPMGSDEGYPNQRPRHLVRVSPFFLGSTTVTNAEFSEFVRQTRYITEAETEGSALCLRDGEWRITQGADWRRPAGRGSSINDKLHHPAVQVTWNDAVAYCRWLSETFGFSLDLPTEAQWEYAAAGPDGQMWAFGNVYDHRTANLEGSDTMPVARFAPNRLGLYDMTGNVYEWCLDWFADSWKDAGHSLDSGLTIDPTGPPAGKLRVLRGGSWFDGERHGRCANRFSAEPLLCSANWGFRPRLALEDELLATLVATKRWGMTLQEMLVGKE